MPVDGAHADQVDDALEVLLRTDGQLDWHCIGTEHITHRLDSLQEVGAATVHLIDVAETGYAILLSLTPYGLALRLYAGNGVEGLDGTVEDAERALHLSGKVDVSGSVDQVELILLIPIGPEGGGAGGGDGDTTLLLLLHPVHRSGTLVHLTDLVDQSGVVEDTLRGGSLTGIDVSHDTDITCEFQVIFCSHCDFFLTYIGCGLQTEVSEGTVSLSHAVDVLLTLEGSTLLIVSIHDLSSKLLCHGLTTSLAGKADEVLHRDGLLTLRGDLSGHLEVGTSDTAALHLYLRGDVLESLLPDLERGLLLLGHLILDDIQSVVEDLEGKVLLSVKHHVIDELRHLLITIDGIRKDSPLFLGKFSHFS